MNDKTPRCPMGTGATGRERCTLDDGHSGDHDPPPQFQIRPEGKELTVEDAYAEDAKACPFGDNPVYKAGFEAGWSAVFKRMWS